MKIVIAFKFNLADRSLQRAVDDASLEAVRQLRQLYSGNVPETSISWLWADQTQEEPIRGCCAFYRQDGSRDSDSSAAFTSVMQRTAEDCYQQLCDNRARRTKAARAAAVARWAAEDDEAQP